MDWSHHGDYPDFRLRDFGQGRDFPGVRHPHLDDGHVVFRLEFQKHQGQAEVIVEIAFRFQNAITARQHVRNRFFGSGLAGRSRDANDRLSPNAPHGGG